MSFIQVHVGDTSQQVIEAITRESSRSISSGFVTVVDSRGVVVGVITDSDIRKKVLDSEFSGLKAENLMSSNFVYIREGISDEDIAFSIQRQLKDRAPLGKVPITYVPVLDSEGRLVEVTHIASLMAHLEMELQQVIVIGLGYVGLTLASVLAEKGFDVVGIEKDSIVVGMLNSRRVPIHEPKLPEILRETVGRNLNFRSTEEGLEPRSSILIRRFFVIAVGTPVDSETGKADLSYLEAALQDMAKHIQIGDVVIVRSTVPVGTTRMLVGERLHAMTGLKPGFEIHLVFAPERTVEGQAIEELQNLPQLISGISEESTRIGISFFSQVCSRIVRTETIEACEFAKLMSNAYRDTMFNFANEMAFLSRKHGIDVTRLIQDANSGYPRNNIPMPSPGVGGPCLSKDSQLLIGDNWDHPSVILASRSFNRFFEELLISDITLRTSESDVVALIGMAFKGTPQTSDTRESFGYLCYQALNSRGNCVVVLDAGLSDTQLESKGFMSRNPSKRRPNVVVICNNHPSNVELTQSLLPKDGQNLKLLVDPWRLLQGQAIEDSFEIVVGLSGEVIR